MIPELAQGKYKMSLNNVVPERDTSKGQGATLKRLSRDTAGPFEHQNNDSNRSDNPLSKIGNHEIILIFT